MITREIRSKSGELIATDYSLVDNDGNEFHRIISDEVVLACDYVVSSDDGKRYYDPTMPKEFANIESVRQ